MYVYNLTAVVNDQVLTAWQEWLQTLYFPTVKESNSVERTRVLRVMNATEPHFAIHHEQQNPQEMLRFIKEILPVLLEKAAERFGEKVLFFGTELKEVSY